MGTLVPVPKAAGLRKLQLKCPALPLSRMSVSVILVSWLFSKLHRMGRAEHVISTVQGRHRVLRAPNVHFLYGRSQPQSDQFVGCPSLSP